MRLADWGLELLMRQISLWRKIFLNVRINLKSITNNSWLLFNNHMKSSLPKRMKNKLLREFKCTPESLLIFFRRRQKNKLPLKSSSSKINRNYKRYMKTTNSMSFIRRFKSQSPKLKGRPINIKPSYKIRKDRPAKWPTPRKRSSNSCKSGGRKTMTYPPSRTPTSQTPPRKSINLFNNWGRRERRSINPDTRARWSKSSKKSRTHTFPKRTCQVWWKRCKWKSFHKGTYLISLANTMCTLPYPTSQETFCRLHKTMVLAIELPK